MTTKPSTEDNRLSDSDQSYGLAIEVIGRDGSIALMKGDQIESASVLKADSRAASSLLPTIANLLKARSPAFVPDFVSVAIGPGSFTGLRIAVTAAKTLAFAWEIPIVEVDSLSALASLARLDESSESPGWRQKSPGRPIFVGLSAYRGQVFRGRFQSHRSTSEEKTEPLISMLSRSQWEGELHGVANENLSTPASEQAGSSWLFAGDRLAFERSGVELPDSDWSESTLPRAVGVGLEAIRKFCDGDCVSAMDVVPNYFRPSAAEESSAAEEKEESKNRREPQKTANPLN